MRAWICAALSFVFICLGRCNSFQISTLGSGHRFAPSLRIGKPWGLRGTNNAKASCTFRNRARPSRAHMVLDGIDGQMDFEQVQQIFELAEAAPAMAASAYHAALASYPTGTDAVTGMSLYFLGKSTSGAIAKKPPGIIWLVRWMICGLCDGTCTHQWYQLLDASLGGLGLDHWTQATVMMLLSTTVYTPLYTAAFLGGLTLLEGKGLDAAQARIKKDYRELTTASMLTWGPINLFLFGAVEPEMRVAAAECIMFLYLVMLALWDEGFFSLSPRVVAEDFVGEQVDKDFLGVRERSSSDLSEGQARSTEPESA